MTIPVTSSAPHDVRRLPPPPPPPVRPSATPTPEDRQALATTSAVRTADAGERAQDFLSGRAPSPSTALATTPPPAAVEASAASRFAGGLWTGVKSGVSGIYEGGKALVTDPVGTGRAVATAAGNAAAATADYGSRLASNPSETLGQTWDATRALGERVANARAEDIGSFIGENAVGAVGGYGAGKALQGLRLATNTARASRFADPPLPEVRRASVGDAPTASTAGDNLRTSLAAQQAEREALAGLRSGQDLRVIAGEGSPMSLRKSGELAASHGGQPSEWRKVSSPPVENPLTRRSVEAHGYQRGDGPILYPKVKERGQEVHDRAFERAVSPTLGLRGAAVGVGVTLPHAAE